MADTTDNAGPRLVADDGTQHQLEGEQTVGRSPDCDITIDSPRVSRKHAVIRTDGDSITVEDAGSSNGTTVNGSKISAQAQVSNGDKICFDKHCFQLYVPGAAADDEATMVAMDATVVASEATVVAEPEPKPEPAPKAAEPEKEAPKPAPEKPKEEAPPSDAPVPGAWVDMGTGEHTRILMPGESSGNATDDLDLSRSLEGSHLLLVAPGSTKPQVLELTLSGGTLQDVWEIGRADACEITIEDGSVSERHAQLVHEQGRWRIVNLVSTNGIFVNGEKRLKAYLGDGDQIKLGESLVVFYSGPGGAAAAAPKAGKKADKSSSSGGGGALKWILLATAVVIVGAAAAFFLI
jgi:pSer/pThr/pTyr-binding forkhead associated (FHA) protein